MHSAFKHRRDLAQFAVANNTLAYTILGLDLVLYLGLVVASILVKMLLIKLILSLLAGFLIAQLFVIGHDAAHDAFVSTRRGNRIITYITFMPALHNPTLWRFVHNRLHHAFTNVKAYNSWSPLSLEEYAALPAWRRRLEQLYRSLPGLGIYYLVERWLKDKFFPRRHTPRQYHREGWRDCLINLTYLALFTAGVCLLALASDQSPWLALVFALVIPFVVWNYAMGLTTYQQHTHPRLPWFPSLVAFRRQVHDAGEVSIYMRYASWYLLITHHCYVHPVHHLNARIPLYKLKKAQQAYMEAFPDKVNVYPFSTRDLLATLKSCKLYDYSLNRWLDFQGKPTTPALFDETDNETVNVIPLQQPASR